ncbi:MAG: methylmalonyl-CoA decarboxylase [Bacteroidales bacterium]|nr:methylmalonyl-CoA decarboxylase [Bacteroidales bacterium]
MKQILTHIENHIGIITLNNDEKRNALTFQLLNELIEALSLFETLQVRAVILRAKKGSKVWSAGLFIDELPNSGEDPLPFNHPLEEAMRAIQRFPAPVIVMAEGSIWGGACDLATVCDIIIGTSNTSFAITPARLGVAYNSSGILHVVSVFGIHIAKEMFYTALPLSAERALNIGALNHLVPAEEIEGFTFKLAKRIAENSPLSVSVAKEQINIISEAIPLATATHEHINELRNRAFKSMDYEEGKRAFYEKRKPEFRGH